MEGGPWGPWAPWASWAYLLNLDLWQLLALVVLAVLVAVINKIRIENGKKPKEIGCSADCANCDKSCTDRTSEIAGGEN